MNLIVLDVMFLSLRDMFPYVIVLLQALRVKRFGWWLRKERLVKGCTMGVRCVMDIDRLRRGIVRKGVRSVVFAKERH